jgi:hypothetical protein
MLGNTWNIHTLKQRIYYQSYLLYYLCKDAKQKSCLALFEITKNN